jgi:hypothetical protein
MILLVSQSSKTLPLMPQLILKLNSFTNFMPPHIKITFCFRRSPITWELPLTTINPSSGSICNSSTPITIDVFSVLFCFVLICSVFLGANKQRYCLLAAHWSLTTMRACMHTYMHACMHACNAENYHFTPNWTHLQQFGLPTPLPFYGTTENSPLLQNIALKKINGQ